LDTGTTLDLASADGVARGDLEINVPRRGGKTAGDANIQAQPGLNITGAATVAVNAFATYNGLPDAVGSVSGAPDALITQAYLNTINTSDTLPFMAAAAANADLASRLTGLTALGAAFHFRPGVEITSATATGDLTVQGDLDLSAFRYGPGVNHAITGSGQPGVLIIRAGGDLNVYGSITDGFAPPVNDAGTAFAKGWVLYAGTDPYGEDQVIPSNTLSPVKLMGGASGSFLASGTPVNYAVNIQAGTFTAGAVVPQNTTSLKNTAPGLTVDDFLGGVYTPQPITQSFIATSNITAKDGSPLYLAGQLVASCPSRSTSAPSPGPPTRPSPISAATTIAAATASRCIAP
jgi:hypothetical protein